MTIDDPRNLDKTATGATGGTVAGVDDLIEIEEDTPAIPPLGELSSGAQARRPIPPPKPSTRESKPDTAMGELKPDTATRESKPDTAMGESKPDPATRESKPDQPADERPPPASIPAPRARVISVGGGSTRPIPSGSAAAWTRPASEIPAPAPVQASAEAPQKPAPPVDLRSKLGIPRPKSDPPRENLDAPDLEGLRIVPPPSLRVPTNPGFSSPPAPRADVSNSASADGSVASMLAARRSPLPPGPSPAVSAAVPKPVVPPPKPASEVQPPQPVQRAVPAPPAPGLDQPPSSEPPTPRAASRARSAEASASRVAMDPSLFDAAGARPKSEPARLRGGTPRPRASSPGFVAARSPGSPPRPTPRTPNNPSGSAGEVQRGDVPGPPRMPNFALSAGASPVRSEGSTPRKSEPPVTASAIAVMRIIAVGSPTREPVLEVEDDLLEDPDVLEPAVEPDAPSLLAAHTEVLEELADEDIAPDSADPVDASPELRAANRVRRDNAKAAPPVAPSAREVEVPKPPPPPPRKPKTPSLPTTKTLPQAKRRQKRPWWEDVFGEDFVRTTFRYSDDQVRREVDFIEEALGVASGGVVLDLGCGPGHHSVELTSRGYGVVGYDLSLYQLALASEVANERGQKLNFLQGDMREMAFEEMFDGIFSWNTSFGYFEEDKNVHVVERVFRALRPGGMFLLDVVNRDFVAASSPCQLWYEGDACVCMDDMSLDFITSRMCVKRSIILDDGRTRELVYSIRVYSLHELGKILHGVGFRVTEASGHPSTPGVFFGEHSPRIIILAQKP